MKWLALVFLVLVSQLCAGQRTWYGEAVVSAGGGTNDIFRFQEPIGAASFTGTGMWASGVDLRRIFTDYFSLETGAGYSHQYYYSSPAAGIEGEDTQGNFGLITVPVTARFDFLKWFFAGAGITASFQTGSSAADDMSGLGLTASLGFQYNLRSDFLVRVRVFGSQYALVHFMPDDYPQMLWNSGVTVGFGYRFIHLGKCNCPEDNSPRRRFY
jgi:hypothetical protein